MSLPLLLSASDIRKRLQIIFPDGIENRNYVTREMAAKTVFVMLYVGAVVGEKRWVRPDQITRMSDAQAQAHSQVEREAWASNSLLPNEGTIKGRWYAANTREPIRDETLRGGLVRWGAVNERSDLPTTSPHPRYALTPSFVKLFDPELVGKALQSAIADWQRSNLTKGALTRVTLMLRGALEQGDRILVTFPGGETRQMEPGPSSIISKAVIEEFAPRFLERPAVIWLSESKKRVVAQDDALAQELGLTIEPERNLPDLILVDLGPETPLLVFVEVVATSGEINDLRKSALMKLATDAGYRSDHVTFLTAFEDRNSRALRTAFGSLAWDSFIWFLTEPDQIVYLSAQDHSDSVFLSHFVRER
ncbi:MAG: BsuBI/PstI family type II restriction endonuclease [Gammaproteobacteria bacterium]|nr:BsuBI/PstI family type II restriction endonuclease [Gammaproteobacteria bacterium]